MATKSHTPLDDPPSASSDDDETEDEQEQEIITQKTIQQSSSEEEEEEESESEEETQTFTPKSSSIFEFESDIKSPSVSNFFIKPSKKITTFSTPEKKQVLKRPSLGADLKNKKKAKVSNVDVVDDEKKSVIKRVWSEEDELMLLQGFIDYQSKKGCSPLSDMDGFYQFAMDSLPVHASKSQLYEKVRRLKKKFRVNSEKVSATGEDPVFVKPHELKLFGVSKKIWGINGCESVSNVSGSNAKTKVRSVKSKPKPKAEVKVAAKVESEVEKVEEVVDDEMMAVEMKDFETLYPYWNAGLNSGISSLNFPKGIVGLFREDLNLIEEAKAKEMNEKWKALFENEAVLRKRKIELLSKVSDVEAI